MRLPPRPPPFDPSTIFSSSAGPTNPALADYVKKANREYLHWDQLRRHPAPPGFTANQAWMAVAGSRLARQSLPLTDAAGRPFSYWLPESTVQTLHRVDRQGGEALAPGHEDLDIFAEMRDRVLVDSLMEEAIATSQIEGALTTRRVAKEMLRAGRKPRDRSEQMIANGYQTIVLLSERTRAPLTLEMIQDIQESMTSGTLDDPSDARRFREAADKIHVVDGRDGEVVFTPPPAADLERRLRALIAFANADPSSDPFIHPLVRAAILHFWLSYEHPFVDGNGRTARALFYWLMLKSGYWLFEFLTISRIINRAPMQYYRSFLYSETDNNDLTYFLLFQLDVTRRALDDLHARLREMADQQQRMKSLRFTARLNRRQLALLDHALRHPDQIYTFESHQRSHGISFQTARTDLLGLLKRGLLVETGSQRPREFLPAPNLPRKAAATGAKKLPRR